MKILPEIPLCTECESPQKIFEVVQKVKNTMSRGELSYRGWFFVLGSVAFELALEFEDPRRIMDDFCTSLSEDLEHALESESL